MTKTNTEEIVPEKDQPAYENYPGLATPLAEVALLASEVGEVTDPLFAQRTKAFEWLIDTDRQEDSDSFTPKGWQRTLYTAPTKTPIPDTDKDCVVVAGYSPVGWTESIISQGRKQFHNTLRQISISDHTEIMPTNMPGDHTGVHIKFKGYDGFVDSVSCISAYKANSLPGYDKVVESVTEKESNGAIKDILAKYLNHITDGTEVGVVIETPVGISPHYSEVGVVKVRLVQMTTNAKEEMKEKTLMTWKYDARYRSFTPSGLGGDDAEAIPESTVTTALNELMSVTGALAKPIPRL